MRTIIQQALFSKKYDYYEQVEVGHHRGEKRQVWTVDVCELPPLHNQELMKRYRAGMDNNYVVQIFNSAS